MDLGLFKRSRTAFWLWIAVPIVTVAVVFSALEVHVRRVEEDLAYRRSTMKALPEIEKRVRDAGEMVRRFSAAPEGKADAPEWVRRRINRFAEQSGLTINSLSIESGQAVIPAASSAAASKPAAVRDRGPAGASPVAADGLKVPYLDVAVGGDGKLFSIVRFLADVQSPESLIAVKSASLRMARGGSDPAYGGEFVLRCYLVSM